MGKRKQRRRRERDGGLTVDARETDRKNRNADDGVDEVVDPSDVGELHGDHERGGVGTRSTVEVLVVVGNLKRKERRENGSAGGQRQCLLIRSEERAN